MRDFGSRVVEHNERLFGVRGFSQDGGRDGKPRLLVFGHTMLEGQRGINVAISRGYHPGEPRVGNLGHIAIFLGQVPPYELPAGSRLVRWPSFNHYGTGRIGDIAVSLEPRTGRAQLTIPSYPDRFPMLANEPIMSVPLDAQGIYVEPLGPLPPVAPYAHLAT